MAAGKEMETTGGGGAARPRPPPPPPPPLLIRSTTSASSPVPPPPPLGAVRGSPVASSPAAGGRRITPTGPASIARGGRTASRSEERGKETVSTVAGGATGAASLPVDYTAEVQEIKKQQPGELRKLLRLLKRKKARQQRRKNQQPSNAVQDERKTLLQRVPLKSKKTSLGLKMPQPSKPSVPADGSETESEAESSDEEAPRANAGTTENDPAGEEGAMSESTTGGAAGKVRRKPAGDRKRRTKREERAEKNGGGGGAVSTATGESSSEKEEEEEEEEEEGGGGGYGGNQSGVVVEYVAADELSGPHAELAKEFTEVFERFRIDDEGKAGGNAGAGGEGGTGGGEDDEEEEEEEEEETSSASKKKKKSGGGEDLTLADEDDDEEGEDDDDEDDEEDGRKGKKGKGERGARGTEKGRKKALSKKQRRLMMRPSVAELKQKTNRPDMVEVWDTTSADPEFLVYLKGLRNTVGVPVHWSHKRRYLQWKRGFEKPPFKLPPHIEATKISEVRSALVDAESQKSLRQRMREKVRPKQNKLAIDYQVLHDCFFKYAVKPPLTGFGDLYYEGKEFERKQKSFVPGKLSDRLKIALGMGPLAPPPWLINMQRYGAPPAYPRLRIPGVTAPIPAGCSYGYHAGGWGKPPVDEMGNPLFGSSETNGEGGDGETSATDDIIGQQQQQQEQEQQQAAAAAAGPSWGELPEGGPDDDEEEDETAPEGGSVLGAGSETPFLEGAASVGGTTSLASGLESPASSWLDLRKSRAGTSSVASSAAKPYTILTPQEVPAGQQAGQLFGVKHTYRMPSAASGTTTSGAAAAAAGGSRGGGGVGGGGGLMGVAAGGGTSLAGAGIVTPGSTLGSSASGGTSTPVGSSSNTGRRILIGGGGTMTPMGSGVATPYGAGGAGVGGGGVHTPVTSVAAATGAGGGGTASSFLLSGTATAGGGIISSGAASSFISGPATPLGAGSGAAGGGATSTATFRGVQTPAGRTAGFRTPAGAGITVTLNPNEMEQEGVFTADIIRQQLRHHEEAAARAKQAAGQIDYADTRKRKGDEIRGTQAVGKSKKKKQFKF